MNYWDLKDSFVCILTINVNQIAIPAVVSTFHVSLRVLEIILDDTSVVVLSRMSVRNQEMLDGGLLTALHSISFTSPYLISWTRVSGFSVNSGFATEGNYYFYFIDFIV